MESFNLEVAFHEAMLGIHRAVGQLRPPYRAHGFLSLVTEYGGKEAADRLLAKNEPSDGFSELLLRGKDKLILSVEFLVLQNPWRQLFTKEQLAVARKRLLDVECELPRDDTSTMDGAETVSLSREETLSLNLVLRNEVALQATNYILHPAPDQGAQMEHRRCPLHHP